MCFKTRRQLLLTALFLLLVTSFSHSENIRLLTFNIRYDNSGDGPDRWDFRREAVAKLIAEHDLAGLQEVKPNQRAWLKEKLADFEVIGIGRLADDQDEASPILYRRARFEAVDSGTFWLSESPDVVGSKSWDSSLPRICTWAQLRDRGTGQTFYFYNVHLDHRGTAARENGVRVVLEHMTARKDKAPVMLTGDFNCTADSAPIRLVGSWKNPALSSTYATLKMPAAGTFHEFKGTPQYGAIDFIFTENDRWKTSACEVLRTTYPGTDGQPRYVSDHFPVRALVELAAGD